MYSIYSRFFQTQNHTKILPNIVFPDERENYAKAIGQKKNVIHTLGPGWQMMDPFGLWST